MVKVSVEIHSKKTARFSVAVQDQSIQRALSVAAVLYPDSVVRVKLPVESEGFLVECSAA